jgi:uncharacterized membrane protein (DUF4010 family)
MLSIAEALLIGGLVGIQRQFSQVPEEPEAAEARDFVIIALLGGLMGLLQNHWLTGATLLGITALLVIHSWKLPGPAHLTSGMSALATFSLAYLNAIPDFPGGTPVAIGTAIVFVALLEAKQRVHRWLREDFTEREFLGTLRFLALIFVIYPLLPDGRFGPYAFFAPRVVWLFVILVSSISFVGYFLEKYLGGERGVTLTGILGGIASTTAATVSLAGRAAGGPQQVRLNWYAIVVANIVQLPRLLIIVLVIYPGLAVRLLLPFALAVAAGILLAWALARNLNVPAAIDRPMSIDNPFGLLPALKFGALFTLITFFSRAADAEFGSQGLLITSFFGGSVDVDAVAVTLAGLASSGLPLEAAARGVIIAIAANGLFKTVLAFTAAGPAFAARVAVAFVILYVPPLLAIVLR